MDRLFSGQAKAPVHRQRPKAPKEAQAPPPEPDDDQATAARDEAERLLKAYEDKDYFEMLHLPAPTADAIGQAVWNCSHAEIARAYRKQSILVHPDKNPGEKARQAFEALNQAYRLLRDPNKIDEILKKAADRAKEEQERRDARASASERIQLNSERLEQAKELREKQGKEFHDRILQQTRRRQQEAQKRRAAVSRYRPADDSDSDGGVAGSAAQQERQERQQQQQQGAAGGEDEEVAVVLPRKKKRPTFL